MTGWSWSCIMALFGWTALIEVVGAGGEDRLGDGTEFW